MLTLYTLDTFITLPTEYYLCLKIPLMPILPYLPMISWVLYLTLFYTLLTTGKWERFLAWKPCIIWTPWHKGLSICHVWLKWWLTKQFRYLSCKSMKTSRPVIIRPTINAATLDRFLSDTYFFLTCITTKMSCLVYLDQIWCWLFKKNLSECDF